MKAKKVPMGLSDLIFNGVQGIDGMEFFSFYLANKIERCVTGGKTCVG